MLEWTAGPDRVCGFGEGGTVILEVDDWRPCNDAPALSGGAGAVVTGSVLGVGLPPVDDAAAPHVVDVEGDDQPEALDGGDLVGSRTHLVVDSTPEIHLAFEGPATVEGSEEPWVRFPERTSLTVGFREVLPPRSTVAVPPTPSGLATAVTAAAGTHRTDGTERSHPGYRPRTPAVEFVDGGADEGRGGPDHGAESGATCDEGTAAVTLTVPDSVVAVLVAAPLAYYLGGALRVEAGPPTVRGPGLRHTFDPLPAFADEVADALRGLVHLDGGLRSVPGESGPGPAAAAREDLADASPAERLASVLASPPGSLPTWPLTTYVDEDVANGRFLPFLLDRLSLVAPARSSSLDPRALLKRSLDEFYRGESPNVEAVDPSLGDSRYHAWLGGGTPVDAFTLLGAGATGGGGPPAAGEAAPYPPGDRDALRVDVVCNEPEMAAERDVAGVYRDRIDVGNGDVVVHERLSTAELAAVLERPTDLVHFIGHCEVDGMRCRDGTLAAADLEACRARSFFLNACGSYYEGYDLVRRGATVGAVTLSAVLDEQAVTLGTAFGELLAAGFAFDRALSIARGEIIVGRDYAVVGDGTHRLRPPRAEAAMCHLERAGDEYELRYDPLAPDGAGRAYRDPFDGRTRPCGRPATATLDRAELRSFLERYSLPVRVDGELRWSDELACSLRAHEQQD